MTASVMAACFPWQQRRVVFALALAAWLGLVASGRSAAQGAALPVLPTGMNVIHGQASAQLNGPQLVITNSANAILNWETFSIGQGQAVRFNQPSSASQVLNRVVGSDPSTILGSLSSNGGVWLLNPHGVLFGANARVEVASLVASTLAVDDADWRARRFRLQDNDALPGSAVVNEGELRAVSGGRLLLLSGRGGIRNAAGLEAPQGQVVMATGRSLEWVDSTSPFVSVRVEGAAGVVTNLGRATAAAGRIDIFAPLVMQRGSISVDAPEGMGAGSVDLHATEDLTLGAGSRTSANGDSGGRITLQGGTARIAGAVEAAGIRGAGGEIRILGHQVGVLEGGVVDASGRDGGGTVLVGGGRAGRDAAVANAQDTYLAPGSSVRADALERGDGGQVIVWGTRSARVYGDLSARGGTEAGNGGFIETSGGWLDATPSGLSLGASAGSPGLWLLDPFEIEIDGQPPGSNFAVVPPFPPPDYTFAPTGADSVISMVTIEAALRTGNVTISTRDGTTDPGGNIIVRSGTLNVSGAQPTTLTLDSPQQITIRGIQVGAVGASAGLNLRLIADGILTLENAPDLRLGAGSLEVDAQRLNFQSGLVEALTVSLRTNNLDILPATARLRVTATEGLALSLRGRARLWIDDLNMGDSAISLEPLAYWNLFLPLSRVGTGVVFAGRPVEAYFAVPPGAAAPRVVGHTVLYESPLAASGNVVVRQQPMSAGAIPALPLEHPTFEFGLGDSSPGFGPIDVKRMDPVELNRLLDARDAYKKRVLAPAMALMQANPSLAEVADCENPQQLLAEDCLVTREVSVTLRDIALNRVARLTPDDFCHSAPDKADVGYCLGLMSDIAQEERDPAAHTGALPSIRRKHAVVIGIDKYGAGLKSLQNAGLDARMLARHLEGAEGFAVSELTDDRHRPTRSTVVRALNRVAVLAREDDSVLVYFAGHGALDERGAGYWLMSDFDLANAHGAIANASLAELLRRMRARQVMLIADACFAGAFVGTPIDVVAKPDAVVPRVRAVMTAGGDHPVADRGQDGHSVFAAALISQLRSIKNWTNGQSLFRQMAPQIRSLLDRAGFRQVPTYTGLAAEPNQKGADYLFEVRRSKR